ncbi:MAG: hypothetical protein WCC66_01875 [Rhizobiaceae bacterium]
MTGGKLNETAQRQQQDRKKRLAEALRANIALRKIRARKKPVQVADDQSADTGSVKSDPE